ncbi:MAG: hypothetical protein NT155_03015 [Candidatus Staskawiczbacteria bacterium]|nr:hypothetical protein [Candidatus Staskawiczbacteria bacterium]
MKKTSEFEKWVVELHVEQCGRMNCFAFQQFLWTLEFAPDQVRQILATNISEWFDYFSIETGKPAERKIGSHFVEELVEGLLRALKWRFVHELTFIPEVLERGHVYIE